MPTRGTRKLMAKSNTATTHMQMKEGGKKRMMDTKKPQQLRGSIAAAALTVGTKRGCLVLVHVTVDHWEENTSTARL